ncbi:MAG: glucose-6-phosphate isomerase [Bacteroidales bacterium]|nr:glucose-6-phosphate isomerase [Bacteroidales bacterium]
MNLNVNIPNNFITTEEWNQLEPYAIHAYKLLTEKSGEGKEFTGWIHLPELTLNNKNWMNSLFQLKKLYSEINIDSLVIIGIGGSYMGTKAIHFALTSHLITQENSIPVLYLGHHIEPTYYYHALRWLESRHPLVIVISKSGTTTEPAIAFRFIRKWIEETFPHESARRIIAITDARKGSLRKLADEKGYTSFAIPDDVGGRFSVLTSVGLVPLTLLGINPEALLEGAMDMQKICLERSQLNKNPALLYATWRHAFLSRGRPIEVWTTFYPQLYYLGEWWKQLFGESEGKQGKGIFPTTLTYTTDLHSMGQYIQDGSRIMFETMISIETPSHDVTIPCLPDNLDDLHYIEGKNLSYVNQKAEDGTIMAHVDGNVPVIRISIPELNEYHLGQLIYFFEFACGISSYMFNVNPFDQPGVEAYKNNMFRLLGKI